MGNWELLRSAIENVVRNALNYTGSDTEVEISLTQRNDFQAEVVVLQIRDHGKGVPEDALKEIFRPFFRVGEARERSSGGAGLD
jgi:signal transduction histidine kinase